MTLSDRSMGRRHLDPDNPNGLTQWAQVVLKMTSATAVIVIAGFLVYRGMGLFENYIIVMAKDLTETKSIAISHAKDSHELSEKLIYLARQQCLILAQTDDQRRGCNQ